MGTELKIIIADDHQIVRMGLASIFGKISDISVTGEARNGIEAVKLARELKPDVILMDLMMPKKNGVQATLEILAENPEAKILILTTFGTADEVRQALDAGAAGVIVKDTLHEQLIAAVKNAAVGKRVISDEIQNHLDAYPPKPVLSPRQIEVLAHVAKGMTTKEISDIMSIGTDGVNAHLRVIFSRLGAASRTEAVSIAMRMNLLKP
jgi:DNA-binding NarL/FixJ family response regulator